MEIGNEEEKPKMPKNSRRLLCPDTSELPEEVPEGQQLDEVGSEEMEPASTAPKRRGRPPRKAAESAEDTEPATRRNGRTSRSRSSTSGVKATATVPTTRRSARLKDTEEPASEEHDEDAGQAGEDEHAEEADQPGPSSAPVQQDEEDDEDEEDDDDPLDLDEQCMAHKECALTKDMMKHWRTCVNGCFICNEPHQAHVLRLDENNYPPPDGQRKVEKPWHRPHGPGVRNNVVYGYTKVIFPPNPQIQHKYVIEEAKLAWAEEEAIYRTADTLEQYKEMVQPRMDALAARGR
ncbi:unnamed protein product, partial [Mesorhabditis spiculigera]